MGRVLVHADRRHDELIEPIVTKRTCLKYTGTHENSPVI